MSSPKAPKSTPPPAPPPPAPTIDEARMRIQEDERLRLRRGRAATILAPENAAPPTKTIGAASALLGK